LRGFGGALASTGPSRSRCQRADSDSSDRTHRRLTSACRGSEVCEVDCQLSAVCCQLTTIPGRPRGAMLERRPGNGLEHFPTPMATILHIEDDPQSRLLVRKLLQRAGHEVLEAVSGVEGARLATARAARPGACSTSTSPTSTATRWRCSCGSAAEVPIVAITAEGDRGDRAGPGVSRLHRQAHRRARASRAPWSPSSGRKATRGSDNRIAASPVPASSPRPTPWRCSRRGERIAARPRGEGLRALSDAERPPASRPIACARTFYRNVSHELATPLTPARRLARPPRAARSSGPSAPAQKKRRRAAMDDAVRAAARRHRQRCIDVTQMEAGRACATASRPTISARSATAVPRRAPRGLRGAVDQRLVAATCPHGRAALRWATPTASRRAVGHLARERAANSTPDDADCRGRGAQRRRRTASCWCVDAGPGVAVDASCWGRIFDPFVQVDGSPTRGHGGAGVGLAIVRGVAEAHGGSARASSGSRSRVAGQTLPGLLVRMQVARAPSAPEAP
jgi:CheY-like chemotaxis protein